MITGPWKHFFVFLKFLGGPQQLSQTQHHPLNIVNRYYLQWPFALCTGDVRSSATIRENLQTRVKCFRWTNMPSVFCPSEILFGAYISCNIILIRTLKLRWTSTVIDVQVAIGRDHNFRHHRVQWGATIRLEWVTWYYWYYTYIFFLLFLIVNK